MKNRFPILVAVVVVCALVSAWIIVNRHESDASVQATDDAYVQADLTAIAPQISGVISMVAVADFQSVSQGDPLLSIDDRALTIALQQAQAGVANAEAASESLTAQIRAHKSVISQAAAVLKVDDANLTLAQANQQRFENLARDGSGTDQDRQQADAGLQVQRATRHRDEQALQAAQDQMKVYDAQLKQAQAGTAAARGVLAQAQLNLSYTQLTAPVSGVVAQRNARVGAYAHAGQPLLTLVPLDSLYIEANFRETQLVNVKAGQSVTLAADALPGIELHGHVERIGPASGVSFSPLAAHNATGNFTKIVQRLPVRIRIDDNQADVARLRVGMSVYSKIHTDS